MSPLAQIPLSASIQVSVTARSGCLSAVPGRGPPLCCVCFLKGLASSSSSALLMDRRMSELE